MDVIHIPTVNIFAGIGIDDMFVVVQCWMNLQRSRITEGNLGSSVLMKTLFRHE
jgi:hypothetical protein